MENLGFMGTLGAMLLGKVEFPGGKHIFDIDTKNEDEIKDILNKLKSTIKNWTIAIGERSLLLNHLSPNTLKMVNDEIEGRIKGYKDKGYEDDDIIELDKLMRESLNNDYDRVVIEICSVSLFQVILSDLKNIRG